MFKLLILKVFSISGPWRLRGTQNEELEAQTDHLGCVSTPAALGRVGRYHYKNRKFEAQSPQFGFAFLPWGSREAQGR